MNPRSLLLSLLLVLMNSTPRIAWSLTTPGVETSWLMEKRDLYRCVPWVIVQSGNYQERADPLICNPRPGDDYPEDFLWNWI